MCIRDRLGGRFRDKVRLYADTHIEDGRATGCLMEPEEVGKVLKGFMDDSRRLEDLRSFCLIR